MGCLGCHKKHPFSQEANLYCWSSYVRTSINTILNKERADLKPFLRFKKSQHWSCEHTVVTSLWLCGFIFGLKGILWTLTLLMVGCSSSCVTTVYSLSCVDAHQVFETKPGSVVDRGNPEIQSIRFHLRDRKCSEFAASSVYYVFATVVPCVLNRETLCGQSWFLYVCFVKKIMNIFNKFIQYFCF